MIEVKDLSLKYPRAKQDALREVSFRVEPGEIFGFLGPSGAGKSTLQKVLTGILLQYRGSVRVFSTEVKKRTAEFYEQIGVEFEFPNFYGKFTALENLNYFASLYNRPVSDPRPLLERVGLKAEAQKRVATYSKGMKMRLAFVRAILHQPKLLFLDEPTSGLDPANARIIKDLILEQKRSGTTVILTTHNMHDAEELCDHVAFLVDGEIRALDTPHGLCAYKAEPRVEYTYRENGGEKKGTAALAALKDDLVFQKHMQSGSLTRIQTKEATLEDVFIRLTGRCLQ